MTNDIFSQQMEKRTVVLINSLRMLIFFILKNVLCLPLAVQSLNSLNDQIASFMVTGPKSLEQEEHAFPPSDKEPLQKSMTLMRHLLVDAQVYAKEYIVWPNFQFSWVLQRGNTP